MTLPSQTARSSYRRNHTFRSKQVLNGKVIIAGIVLAAATIIVWVIIARRDGGANAPPAAATNALPNETPQGDAQQPSGTLKSNAGMGAAGTDAKSPFASDDEPRIVMGEDVPALPLKSDATQPSPQRQPERRSAAPEQLTSAPPADAAQPATNTAATEPPADRATPTQPQSPRAVTHAQRLLDEGMREAAAGKLVDARRTLSMALEQLDPHGSDAGQARKALSEIGEVLVFSSSIAPNDPYAKSHKIQSGEMLSTIAKPLGVDWKFIARINDIADPSRIRAGQAVKIINGRFHAVVRKAGYELDLYLGDGSDRVYVRTFSVGLGELDSTPVGRFAVASRVPNPDWKNPRTGEYFDRNDPRNPIGEFWVGMKGIEEKTKGMTGYGVHGTIDNESIGKQASMGCVRMRPDDIALVYELLTNELNTIEIVP